MSTVIAVQSFSNKIPLSDVRSMTSVCNEQLRRHCAPVWDAAPWQVRYFPQSAELPADALPIIIFDEPDEPDALGYHSETPDGLRYGKVFVNPILDAGGTVLKGDLSVSVTLSHEVLEVFIDPDINLWADGPKGRSYAYEVCDPVEADTYLLRGISVSNFVFRSWFDAENPEGAKFDFMGLLQKSYEVRPGGYAIWWDTNGEHVTYGAEYSKWKKAGKKHAASRTNRRGAEP